MLKYRHECLQIRKPEWYEDRLFQDWLMSNGNGAMWHRPSSPYKKSDYYDVFMYIDNVTVTVNDNDGEIDDEYSGMPYIEGSDGDSLYQSCPHIYKQLAELLIKEEFSLGVLWICS